MRFFYAYGFRTSHAAKAAMEDAFADGQISEAEHPIVRSYSVGGIRFWGVEIDG